MKLGTFFACYIWHLDVEREGVRKKLFHLRIGKWEFQKKWAVPL